MMKTNLSDAHWRDSARRTRFFFIDAIAAFPLLLLLLHVRFWTFLITLSVIIFLSILERFNFTIPIFFRFLRSWLAGPHREAHPWGRR
jgi:intracellular multiplication protein IcmT